MRLSGRGTTSRFGNPSRIVRRDRRRIAISNPEVLRRNGPQRASLDNSAAITLEFENINADYLRIAEQATLVHPGAQFLEICQDRVLEKTSLDAAGFPTTPFRPVQSIAAVESAIDAFGTPLVLKTARSGYDGKGQVVVRERSRAAEAFRSLATDHAIAEKWISYTAEVSMVTARNRAGQIACYPLFENEHANHILDVSRCPVSPRLAKRTSRAGGDLPRYRRAVQSGGIVLRRILCNGR